MADGRKRKTKTVDTYVSSLRGLFNRSLDKDEGRDVSIEPEQELGCRYGRGGNGGNESSDARPGGDVRSTYWTLTSVIFAAVYKRVVKGRLLGWMVWRSLRSLRISSGL